MARMPVSAENIDFESMSDSQLRELAQHVKDAQRERFTSRLDELRMLAHEAGYEITKIGEGAAPRRRRRSSDAMEGDDRRREVLPKYRGPNGEEWSGRGRKPKWVEDLLAKRRKLEEFLISPAQQATAVKPSGEPVSAAQE